MNSKGTGVEKCVYVNSLGEPMLYCAGHDLGAPAESKVIMGHYLLMQNTCGKMQ